MRGGALRRQLFVGARVVQHAEPQDGQPAEAEHVDAVSGEPVDTDGIHGRGQRPRRARRARLTTLKRGIFPAASMVLRFARGDGHDSLSSDGRQPTVARRHLCPVRRESDSRAAPESGGRTALRCRQHRHRTESIDPIRGSPAARGRMPARVPCRGWIDRRPRATFCNSRIPRTPVSRFASAGRRAGGWGDEGQFPQFPLVRHGVERRKIWSKIATPGALRGTFRPFRHGNTFVYMQSPWAPSCGLMQIIAGRSGARERGAIGVPPCAPPCSPPPPSP